MLAIGKQFIGLVLLVLLMSGCGGQAVEEVASPEMAATAVSVVAADEEPVAVEMVVEEATAVAPVPTEAMPTEAMPTEAMPTEAIPTEAMATEAPVTESEPESAPAIVEIDRPIWQTMPLVNARTGETFTLADFAGQTVFVEPMATWCSNCRRQLGNVQAAREQAGDDVVFVALSVETNISATDLANYANNAGFDFHFAVLTPDHLRALAAEFGQTVSNPPATPHFIIRPDGSFTGLVTGIEPPADLLRQIEEAASQG